MHCETVKFTQKRNCLFYKIFAETDSIDELPSKVPFKLPAVSTTKIIE